ncbi:M56 family metallopeptidase [Streptomyces sp. FXJ1.172]|uniref:M56 family metallopeptidase n=1 Tax=Streptomyces sp. FXJ1.172 TaxID=710705 RepID=UPI0007CF86AD|nr:M56 family metallopeptidase [Streptomyces sp. FXJ1.172]WEO93890.1 M56 family metallopeptidase [Streptomyces sp. FXJ1.172]
MRITVYLLLLASVALAMLGPQLGRRLAPAAAVRALTLLSLVATAALVWGLTAVTVGGLGRTDAFQDQAHSSPAALASDDPVPGALGALAAGLLAVSMVRALTVTRRRWSALRALAPLRQQPAAGDLVVIEAEGPDAYALPGRSRRVVVTSAMLRALPADEQAVLLAHERAHLLHRHHRYAAVAETTAACNPLLRPVRDLITFHIERWADEEAARATGSRLLAARSLARAALAMADATRAHEPQGALAYLRHKVTARVGALQAERPTSHWVALSPALAVTALTGLAFAEVTWDFARCLHALRLF